MNWFETSFRGGRERECLMTLGDIEVTHKLFVCGYLCAYILRDPQCPAVILCVWAVTGVLLYLACERLLYLDYQIQATVMIIVSGCAVAARVV